MKRQWKWWLPLLFLAVLAPFTPALDLWAARLFYKGGGEFYNSPFFRFMFSFGEKFGFFVASVALAIFALSFLSHKWKKWRRGSLAVVLTLVIGAGLIVNLMFKEFWGRPRPKQLTEFAGTQEYLPFWKPNFGTVTGDHQKSFPSGHAAMGFFYLSLILVGRRYSSKTITYSGVALTSFWGAGLMLTRVVQGGHFVSDVTVSPAIMWWVALLVDRYVFYKEAPLQEEVT